MFQPSEHEVLADLGQISMLSHLLLLRHLTESNIISIGYIYQVILMFSKIKLKRHSRQLIKF